MLARPAGRRLECSVRTSDPFHEARGGIAVINLNDVPGIAEPLQHRETLTAVDLRSLGSSVTS